MTILPIPVDLLTPFVEMAKRANEQGKAEEKAKAEAASAPPASLPSGGEPRALPNAAENAALPTFSQAAVSKTTPVE
jgi:hypothetical protein